MKEIRHLNYTINTKKIDAENMILRGVIGSDDSIDRHGDSINPNGWELKNFLKNPVIMLFHDYNQFPIGKAINLTLKGGKLLFDIQFSKTLELARQTFDLIKEGILKATSVGFIPLKFGESGSKYTINSQELLELSIVPIPANANAIFNSLGDKKQTLLRNFTKLLRKIEIEKEDTPEKEKETEKKANKEVVVKEEEKKEVEEEVKKEVKEEKNIIDDAFKKELEVLVNSLIDEKLKSHDQEIKKSIISNLKEIESDEDKANDPNVLLLNSLRGELQKANKETGKSLKAFNQLLKTIKKD